MAEAKIDIEALKSRHDLSAIVGRRVKLRKAGHELVGLCQVEYIFEPDDDRGLPEWA